MDEAGRVARIGAEVLEALPGLWASAEPLRRAYVDLVHRHRAPFTDNLVDPHAWAVYVHYAEVVARVLGDPGARIVDWGAGYGHVTALLRARGQREALAYHVYPPAHVAPFEAAFDIPAVVGKDPNVLALPSGSADAVLSSGVLEHVREDGVGREEAVLAEIARVLRPGGWFLGWNLPTPLAPGDLWGKVRGRWYHEHRFPEARLRGLLRGAGLEVVHVERHGGTPLGAALKALGAAPWVAFAWDHRCANAPGFRLAAQNLAFAARRPGAGGQGPRLR